MVKCVGKIDSLLLKDVLFEFFPAVWEKNSKGKEGKWFPLSQKMKFFIHSHGHCFAETKVFDDFHRCHSTDWTYLKFNSRINEPTFICDCQHDLGNGENGASISFSNKI